MTNRNNGTETGRNTAGQFTSGNPGRPRGARHKATRAAQELLDGEAEALTRQAVTMALEGDSTALRLCLERIAPPRRDAPIQFDLPAMETAQDAASAAGAIVQAAAAGDLTLHEAAGAMALVESYRRTLETSELESRLSALEEVRQ